MCSGTRLFVGNLPTGVKDLEQGLKEEFSHYGEVRGVEVKCKKDVEGREIGQFAFVTIQADNHSVNKCIHEFSEQEWKGAYLNVSVAKESFLERLKREREENERKKGKQEKPPDAVVANGHIEKINIKIPEKKTVADYEERKEIYTQKINKTPKEKYTPRNNEDFHLEDTSAIANDSPDVKKEPKRPKRPKNRIKNIQVEDVVQKEVKQLTPADEKRLKSMQNMRSAYNEKKSAIKMALSSVDKKVNKIVFDDDGEQVATPILNNSNIQENGDTKSRRTKRKGVKQDAGEEGISDGKIRKTKSSLFDDGEEDEDGEEYNFEVKEHFQGEAGQKLLQLQSRYHSDKRFVLDERFMENENTEAKMSSNDSGGRSKPRQQSNEVEEEEEGEEMDVEGVQDGEKIKEIEILESILGTSVKTSNRIKDNQDGRKQIPIKTMLRYDPTRPDHDKFMSKPKQGEEGGKKSKKEKKEMMERKLEEEQQKNVAPEVSQERYYKVNQSLKQVIQNEDNKTFSLLSMFGKATVEDESNKTTNVEESYRTETIENNDKVKNPLRESNPFRYDSDTDEEREEKAAKRAAAGVGVGEESTEDTPTPLLITENFFFTSDDPRLQEGVKFFLEAKPASERSRVELKNLVKKRIRNNERNERYHQSKVQQNHTQRQPQGGRGRPQPSRGRHQPSRGRGQFKRR